MEQWVTIKDFPKYEISNHGRVRSNQRKNPIIMKPGQYSNGYLFVLLINDNIRKSCSIHRLVLENFCPCENMEYLQVNHIDCDRQNNHLENLEWATPKENREYREEKKHTPKAETILVQFLDDREDMIFDSMTAAAEYFGVTRKAINKYLDTQNIRKDRKIQAHFYRVGRTYDLNK